MADATDEATLKRQQLAESKRISLAFLKKNGLDRLYMLRLCLSPQIALMQSTLSENQDSWQTQQLASSSLGQGRSYRVVNHVVNCWGTGRFRKFLIDTKAIAQSSTLWNHASHTEGTASDIFRMCSRSASVLMELVVMKSLTFPLLLFSLLHDDSQVDKILVYHSDFTCCLDDFSKAFLDRFPSRESLLSSQAKTILTVIAEFAFANIYDVERTHT